jgi:polyhydroxyalkanoate synthase
VPASVLLAGFRIIKPTGGIRSRARLLENAWNPDYVASHQAMTTWAMDQVPFPGTVARQTIDMFARRNAFIRDRAFLDGDHIHLTDIRVPHLTVIAERDHIIPVQVAESLPSLVGSIDNEVLRLDAGHIGIIVGRTAARVTIPRIVDFVIRQSDTAPALPTPPK